MFLEVELKRDVVLCAGHFREQVVPNQQIMYKLMQDLMWERASEEHGFYLAVTSLNKVWNLKRLEDNNNNNNNKGHHHHHHHHHGPITFPVSFTCRTFLPRKREVLKGVVNRVLVNGVFLSCGPLRYIYLSVIKMPDYHRVGEDENMYFVKDDNTKIALGVVVRFKVLGVRFNENKIKKRNDFYMLATIEGRSLGPISLAGDDEPYM